MPRRASLTVALILVAVVLVFYGLPLLNDAPDDELPLPAALADEPNLHMVDATIVQYRQDGSESYTLLTERLRHFDERATTLLTGPRLTLTQAPDPPWQISAAQGQVRTERTDHAAEEEVVFLREDVQMLQEQANGGFIRLNTSELHYYPQRRYAETDQNVMIDSDIGRTHAVGLKSELRKGLLFLSSSERQRVHTIVLPGQFKVQASQAPP